jgi:hypothetical protein
VWGWQWGLNGSFPAVKGGNRKTTMAAPRPMGATRRMGRSHHNWITF